MFPRLLTPVGRYFFLAAVVLLGIGIHRGINLLILLGYAMLLMLLANGWAARRSVRGLIVRRRIGEWAFAGSPYVVEVELHNPSRRARLGLRIEDSGTDTAAAWLLDRLPRGESLKWRRHVIPPHRGRWCFGSLQALSGYPFGLVERSDTLTTNDSTIVLPRLGSLHRGRFLRYLRSLSVQPQYSRVRHQSRANPAAQAEFHGLRAFHSGDSPRLIHWRTSARCGQLMVREFEDEISDNLFVILDPTLPRRTESERGKKGSLPLSEQFEAAVSLTATICWEWCRQRGDRLTLATSEDKPVILEGVTGPTHARRVLEHLALIQCIEGPSHSETIAHARERLFASAVVVLVSLGRSSLAEGLSRVLGRRVNCLDAALAHRFDFYTPPD